MGRQRGGAARVALGIIALCASCGLTGNGTWRELTSEHFVVRTDLPSDRARDLVGELELDRALLVAAMPALAGASHRVSVYAYRSNREYRELTGAPRDSWGQAFAYPWGQQAITLRRGAGPSTEEQARIVAHELAHALAYRVIPFQPRWFAEGLAGYLSAVARVRRGNRYVGVAPAEQLPAALLVPARELLAWTREGAFREDRFYGTSELLVRMLIDDEPAGFADLERRLADGEPADTAWNAAFPRWSLAAGDGPERLDDRLRAQASSRWEAAREVAAEVSVHPIERVASVAEVHAWRLWSVGDRSEAALERELDDVLAVDPAHVVALSAMADRRQDAGLARALARRAIAGHPGDALAWRFRGVWAEAPADREASLRRAVALAPDDPTSLIALADELALENPGEAEVVAARAVALAPWASHAHRARAQALARLGRCGEAALEVRRAERGGDGSEKDALAAAARRCGAPAERAAELRDDARRAAERGANALALRFADASLALEDTNEVAWAVRGWALEHLGQPEAAIAAYRRAIGLDPESRWAWQSLGSALQRQGKLIEAEVSYRRQVAVAPDEPGGHLALGLLLLGGRRYAEAVPPLERAAQLAPKGLEAPQALARAHLALGQPRAAVEALETLVARGGSPAAQNAAAWILVEAGAELDRAAAWAEASVPGHARALAEIRAGRRGGLEAEETARLAAAWDTLGWVRYRQGRLAEAERWIAAAEQVCPGALVSEHLGRVLEAAGRGAEAAQAYARACAREPTSPARPRLAALVGESSAPRSIEDARRALAGPWPSFANLPGRGAEASVGIELVLAADGTVAEVRTADGGPPPAGAQALRGSRHGVVFPDPETPPLVLRVTWRCTAEACGVDRGEAPRS